ncbi:hypothetical protein [uncultured Maribacter sp.]
MKLPKETKNGTFKEMFFCLLKLSYQTAVLKDQYIGNIEVF